VSTDRAPLRADAERNRARIVEAARAVFCERGLGAPLEQIAQCAGVGIATLYRRFPTREELIAACFAPRLAEYDDAVEEALRAPDAWSGFCRYLERLCGMQAADRAAKDILAATFPTSPAVEEQRRRVFARFAELVGRAQAEGKLRADFVSQDVMLVLMANAGVVQATREAAPDAWKRFVALMIEAFRADRAHPLPPPPAPAHMSQAQRQLGRLASEGGPTTAAATGRPDRRRVS
jgi:AcrR family transcriptional regulator